MSMNLEPKHRWWKEPMVWLIIALPLAAVTGGALTVWFATRDPDTLVSEDYYKEGMAIRQVVEREARATALGIAAELTPRDGLVVLRLSGADPAPQRLELAFIHPTREGQDLRLTLLPTANGDYQAALPALPAGKRRLSLEPDDHSWRLTGTTTLPLAGSLSLLPHPSLR